MPATVKENILSPKRPAHPPSHSGLDSLFAQLSKSEEDWTSPQESTKKSPRQEIFGENHQYQTSSYTKRGFNAAGRNLESQEEEEEEEVRTHLGQGEVQNWPQQEVITIGLQTGSSIGPRQYTTQEDDSLKAVGRCLDMQSVYYRHIDRNCLGIQPLAAIHRDAASSVWSSMYFEDRDTDTHQDGHGSCSPPEYSPWTRNQSGWRTSSVYSDKTFNCAGIDGVDGRSHSRSMSESGGQPSRAMFYVYLGQKYVDMGCDDFTEDTKTCIYNFLNGPATSIHVVMNIVEDESDSGAKEDGANLAERWEPARTEGREPRCHWCNEPAITKNRMTYCKIQSTTGIRPYSKKGPAIWVTKLEESQVQLCKDCLTCKEWQEQRDRLFREDPKFISVPCRSTIIKQRHKAVAVK